jgi:hypothetical protein
MTATIERPAVGAAMPPIPDEQVLGMAFPDVVRELVDVLGAPNVALIGGVSKTSLVADWLKGTRPKSDDRAMRVRLALRLARIVRSRFACESVQAWFWGANRRLDDEAPIAVLSDQPFRDIQRPLLGAAREFVQA